MLINENAGLEKVSAIALGEIQVARAKVRLAELRTGILQYCGVKDPAKLKEACQKDQEPELFKEGAAADCGIVGSCRLYDRQHADPLGLHVWEWENAKTEKEEDEEDFISLLEETYIYKEPPHWDQSIHPRREMIWLPQIKVELTPEFVQRVATAAKLFQQSNLILEGDESRVWLLNDPDEDPVYYLFGESEDNPSSTSTLLALLALYPERWNEQHIAAASRTLGPKYDVYFAAAGFDTSLGINLAYEAHQVKWASKSGWQRRGLIDDIDII